MREGLGSILVHSSEVATDVKNFVREFVNSSPCVLRNSCWRKRVDFATILSLFSDDVSNIKTSGTTKVRFNNGLA